MSKTKRILSIIAQIPIFLLLASSVVGTIYVYIKKLYPLEVHTIAIFVVLFLIYSLSMVYFIRNSREKEVKYEDVRIVQ